MLEGLQTLVAGYWSKLKAGVINFACPIPISMPFNFPKKTIIHVTDYPICTENFHCNHFCLVLCGHYYHPWCLNVQAISPIPKCKVQGCEQEFHHEWHKSFCFLDRAQDDANSLMKSEVALSTRLSSNYITFLLSFLSCICDSKFLFLMEECISRGNAYFLTSWFNMILFLCAILSLEL